MYLEPIVVDTMATGLLAGFDDGNEMPAEHFRNLFRDEASIRKMKEPLNGHDRLRLDPIMRDTLFELAWFYDPSRTEELPLLGPADHRENAQTRGGIQPLPGDAIMRAPAFRPCLVS